MEERQSARLQGKRAAAARVKLINYALISDAINLNLTFHLPHGARILSSPKMVAHVFTLRLHIYRKM